MSENIQLTVDALAEAAYAKLTTNEIVTSTPHGEAFVIDLDKHGVAVGIEFLDLDADIPFSELTSQYHVHSAHIEALRQLRPSIRGFLTMQVGAQSWGAKATIPTLARC